tara:strand:+ start:285 stop:956 length:672 start_codon:yes stop_codon:yes gene_type:complete
MSIKNKYFVRFISSSETWEWFLRKHYAKRIPHIVHCLGLFDADKVLQGVISFGISASKPLVCGAFNGKYKDIFLELNRLCINDHLDKNVLSFFVGQSLNLLKKPKAIVSYADTSLGHHGYIYQATNWIYTGLSDAHKEWRMFGSNLHSKPLCEKYNLEERKNNPNKFYFIDRPRKHRYFYFVGNRKEKREMRDSLSYAVLPYPKGDNKRYDSSYIPSVQRVLF